MSSMTLKQSMDGITLAAQLDHIAMKYLPDTRSVPCMTDFHWLDDVGSSMKNGACVPGDIVDKIMYVIKIAEHTVAQAESFKEFSLLDDLSYALDALKAAKEEL